MRKKLGVKNKKLDIRCQRLYGLNRIILIVLLFGFFLVGGVLGQISNCCERRTDGAWCIDADERECDDNYLMEPTACASTSYCALGTCVNKRDGDCMENTPKLRCDSNIGFWSQSHSEDLAQCQLGCCFIGDQAAYVTQTKCKSFASLYSIDTHFQSNIQNEISCISSAFPDAKGACVFEREFETTCKMTTRSECSTISDTEFHEGFLCTADELATNCAPTEKTTCVDGRDEVFFVDSCGNTANVYDSSKVDEVNGQIIAKNGEEDYWTFITAADCGEGPNINSATCGDCDYFEGNTCKEYDRSKDSVSPEYGDFVCRNLGCSFDTDGDGQEEEFLHGETWCAESEGAKFLEIINGDISERSSSSDNSKNNLPGSRFFRLVCYNGDVTVEACADNRAEVCIQSERDYLDENNQQKTFKSAVCRVNAWQDCVAQTDREDCEDTTIRDCQWLNNGCVPLISPGFNFWGDEEGINEEATGICSLASKSCEARYERSLGDQIGGQLGGIGGTENEFKQISGEECFDEDMDYKSSWGSEQNQMCVSLGDCQGKLSGDKDGEAISKILNYLGFK